jgi:hypothetical protein
VLAVTVPAELRAGDTVQWIEPATVDLDGNAATSASWVFTTYLRTNTAAEGATVVGTARADGGWNMAILAATSSGFDAGSWSWQSRITSGALVRTVGSGSTTVLPALDYAGSPAAFDGRSQAEQDLAAVSAAIRAIISKGSKQYTIGTRSYTSQDLGVLMQRESQLKAIVAREKAAEKVAQGLGDPRNLFVRFS